MRFWLGHRLFAGFWGGISVGRYGRFRQGYPRVVVRPKIHRHIGPSVRGIVWVKALALVTLLYYAVTYWVVTVVVIGLIAVGMIALGVTLGQISEHSTTRDAENDKGKT